MMPTLSRNLELSKHLAIITHQHMTGQTLSILNLLQAYGDAAAVPEEIKNRDAIVYNPPIWA